MIHLFDTEIAEKYGVNAAVLLQHIGFWIKTNEANQINFYDGTYWTCNSRRAFKELFPYMSERQILTALDELIADGVLITGNYNKSAYDRTLWYALTKKGKCILHFDTMDDVKMSNGISQNVKCILPKKEQEETKEKVTQKENKEEEEKIKKENKEEEEKIKKENKEEEEKIRIMCIDIISYLNKKCKTKYKTAAKDTVSMISARIAEGYTVEDFKKVIDNQYTKWHGTEYEQYLRPDTLFRPTKFDVYLNAPLPKKAKVGITGIAIGDDDDGNDLIGVI